MHALNVFLSRWANFSFSASLASKNMKSFWTFSRIILNFLNISCLNYQNGSLQVSNVITAKSILFVLLFSIFNFYLVTCINLARFLPDGQSLENFSSFTLKIFRMIGGVPVFVMTFAIVNHVVKRRAILNFFKIVQKFNENFISFAKCETFLGMHMKYISAAFLYLTVLKIIEMAMMVKMDVYVIVSYLARIYCDYTINILLLMFSIAIKYFNFLLRKFNEKLTNDHELEIASEYYESILKILNHFYKIFHHEIFVIISFNIVKIVLMVRKIYN